MTLRQARLHMRARLNNGGRPLLPYDERWAGVGSVVLHASGELASTGNKCLPWCGLGVITPYKSGARIGTSFPGGYARPDDLFVDMSFTSSLVYARLWLESMGASGVPWESSKVIVAVLEHARKAGP